MTADAAQLCRAAYEAFNRGDVDGALATMQPDVEIVNVAWNVTYRGHDGFREFMRTWKTMDPNCRVEVIRQMEGEDGVTSELVFHATHVGPLHAPTGATPPTGKTVAVPVCEVWRLRDGKLASDYMYSDGVTILAQLGLLPEPATA